MSGTVRIRQLTTVEEVRSLDAILAEYIRFVCADLDRAAGVSFDPASLLAKTRASLDRVVPPKGRTFAAEDREGERLGMVFLRPSGLSAMEIKRLYVVPSARGSGAGRALVEAAVDASREAGARALRLDTTRNLTAAISLYQRMGFAFRDPYPESDHYDDERLLPHLVFMEKPLV